METGIDPSLLVITSSLIVQVLSAVFAFNVIMRSGKPGAGILMLIGVLLMACRRFISLYRLLSGQDPKPDLLAECFAFGASALLLAGFLYLKKLIASVRTLSGLLPICASCKKIRDDKGSWLQIESYIRKHSKAEFSHGLCPDCANRMYPDYPMLNEPRLKL